jgi:hypothetical protein
MGWLIALDVLLWIAAAVFLFAYGQWIIALILAILAILLLLALSGGNFDASDIFDIF